MDGSLETPLNEVLLRWLHATRHQLTGGSGVSVGNGQLAGWLHHQRLNHVIRREIAVARQLVGC